jgi:NAD(P)H-quinone oxidoreductase subunit 5
MSSTATIESILLLAIPAMFFVASWVNERKASWNLAMAVSLMALAISATSGLLAIFGEIEFGSGLSWATHAPMSIIMLCLISFIAFVNIKFSRHYMSGNSEEERKYLRWLLITLSFVTLVVVSNHMIVLAVAWAFISASLHQLLIFYPDRQRAALAAYKKYIFARIAEVFLAAGILLLYLEHDTWLISEIVTILSEQNSLSTMGHMAAVFLALAALIKCAQLPLHGWLIQVVEAPTPVSALLHAGIINLGGFLMIIFSPLIMLSDYAQWLLLIVGGLTTVLAALIMMTRASVKVRLAWSTMSQMGLMLVECALGLFELAVLHLIAHSCYKAYAFLNSGTEVETRMKKRLAKREQPSSSDWLFSIGFASMMIATLILAANIEAPYSPWLLIGIALTLLIAERRSRTSSASISSMIGLAFVVLIAYFALKSGTSFVIPRQENSVGSAGDLWMSLLFIIFFFVYIALKYYKHHPKIMPVWRAFYAGFYLDEYITRLSLRIYPKKLPVRFKPKTLNIPKEELL